MRLLENELCTSILNLIFVVKKSPNFDDPHADTIASGYTWPRVFERTMSVYHDAVDQKIIPG